ncbi:MAG: heme lyase CcmF/NrfE family subunit [Nitrospinae bacterium]|nr:heme lyase CcmF/NrfE family subunit [Nitrospinota bacterium]
MTEIGEFCLYLSLASALYAAVSYGISARNKQEWFAVSADRAVIANCVFLLISSAALVHAFLGRDFSVQYVANYSDRNLSAFYTISAFWAGQKGSLLLWALLLAVFSCIAVLQNREKNRELMPVVNGINSAFLAFFLFLLCFSTPPFEKLPYTPEDGHGLNPMLQNPGMIFHPPSLYLGYVGFTIPFSFAMAALITGKLDDVWIRTTRKWTLFSWFFLSLGNLLGADWAYVELGWGGYWAWDPVENASFMPWLAATAYLHSVMIQEKKNMLKVWNMFLILLTFSLTIFGTFITRSGLIQSVHAFDETTLGYYFLFFLAVTIVFSTFWIVKRLPDLKSENELDSILSRESSFLFNNLLFVGMAFATFWGTIFPIISEAARGVKITVGPPFFNQVNVPIGLALLLLMGVCPLIAWRKASAKNLRKNFLFPGTVSAVCGAALYPFIGRGHFWAWLSFAISIFVVLTILIEYFRGAKVRMENTGENFFIAAIRLTLRNKRRYGGYIIHIGIVMMYVGIAGSSSYSVEETKSLMKGESMSIKDYVLTYEGMETLKPNPDQETVVASLSVSKGGKKIWDARPQKDFYAKESMQPSTEVDIRSTVIEDLYIIFAEYRENGAATFKVLINPLTLWLWIGGYVLAFGAALLLLPDMKEKKRLLAMSEAELGFGKLIERG